LGFELIFSKLLYVHMFLSLFSGTISTDRAIQHQIKYDRIIVSKKYIWWRSCSMF